MNLKIIQIAAILLVTLAILSWLRSDGRYDFDIRSILPFMRGKVTMYDWGSLTLIVLGLWGLGRLNRMQRPHDPRPDDHAPKEPPCYRSPRGSWREDDHE
jgi:hypothetical protein